MVQRPYHYVKNLLTYVFGHLLLPGTAVYRYPRRLVNVATAARNLRYLHSYLTITRRRYESCSVVYTAMPSVCLGQRMKPRQLPIRLGATFAEGKESVRRD